MPKTSVYVWVNAQHQNIVPNLLKRQKGYVWFGRLTLYIQYTLCCMLFKYVSCIEGIHDILNIPWFLAQNTSACHRKINLSRSIFSLFSSSCSGEWWRKRDGNHHSVYLNVTKKEDIFSLHVLKAHFMWWDSESFLSPISSQCCLRLKTWHNIFCFRSYSCDF